MHVTKTNIAEGSERKKFFVIKSEAFTPRLGGVLRGFSALMNGVFHDKSRKIVRARSLGDFLRLCFASYNDVNRRVNKKMAPIATQNFPGV